MRPARSFNDKWREGRLWLVYDKQKMSMTCSYCVEYSSTSVAKCSSNLKNKLLFVSGCTNFRFSAVNCCVMTNKVEVCLAKNRAIHYVISY